MNGQKVWTSLAHFAKWGLLVARTNPDVEKHKGLTYFVIDMDQPGVEVRPLRQMTGGAEFNEVYFTNARVPDENRLGEIGAGWSTVVTTLMNERVFIGGGIAPRGAGMIQTAVKLWKDSDRKSPAMRDRLMRLYIRAETVRLTNARAQQKRAIGNPGPEGSIGKLANAELNQAIGELCVDLMGPEGMLYETLRGEPRPRADRALGRPARLVPPQSRQHDRGRHVRGDAQHPRRAHPRPPRRRPRRPRRRLERRPPQLTTTNLRQLWGLYAVC